MVKKILLSLLLTAGILSLQAQTAKKKSTPVADEGIVQLWFNFLKK
ncbi:MAG TPA: hypothetical protein VIK10_04085 [Prolixibacteraceae bacterium]